jgi:hypothetical protein
MTDIAEGRAAIAAARKALAAPVAGTARVPPGLRRLRASPLAETIRAETLSDQRKARAEAKARIEAAKGRSSDDAGLEGIADAIRRFHRAAKDGLKQESDGAAAWRESTMALARELLRGRQLHQNDNNAFGAWLKAGGLGDDFLGKDDRAALIAMAEHPEIAASVLEATAKRSWRTIWLDEIAPKVEAAGGFRNPAITPSGKREQGRPRQVPAPTPVRIDAKPAAVAADRVEVEVVGYRDNPLGDWESDEPADIASKMVKADRMKAELVMRALMDIFDA